jgi:hypothetical protein
MAVNDVPTKSGPLSSFMDPKKDYPNKPPLAPLQADTKSEISRVASNRWFLTMWSIGALQSVTNGEFIQGKSGWLQPVVQWQTTTRMNLESCHP